MRNSSRAKGKYILMDMHSEEKNIGLAIRDAILGGQDGLVTVLGLVLAVASATGETHVCIIAGLAALLAGTVSMTAVAYTSQKASKEYFLRVQATKRRQLVESPDVQRQVLRAIYRKKGFKDAQLDKLVQAVTSNSEEWLSVLMAEELDMAPQDQVNPFSSALLVGVSAITGSFIPLIPFFFIPVSYAMWSSVVLTIIVLFAAGAFKTRYTIGKWMDSGMEMAVIGTVCALSGFVVGRILASVPIP